MVDLIAVAEDDILVAHNPGFDMGVIKTARAAIMIHAADRWGAIDLPELATLVGVRVSTTLPSIAAAAS